VPISAREIFGTLRQWPHRGAGSEEEMEAREALITALSGEHDVFITEEGFLAPRTYLPFFWAIALGACAALMLSHHAPLFMGMFALLFVVSHFLYFDWRVSPLIWLGAKNICANLVVTKGSGSRLVILMAHLDSAPASFAYRPGPVRHFKAAVYGGSALLALSVAIPLLEAQGAAVPFAVKALVAGLILLQAVLASLDFWRFGHTPGANDNLTGVAAATALASRLWRNMPANTEVRLVITSSEEAGMLGAQHYWRHHREELKHRDTHVLNFDTVGQGNLSYVVETGGFTPVYYDGQLALTAAAVTRLDNRYRGIRPARHRVGDFDTVWFARDNISALTIAAYDDDGFMPNIHTMEDRALHVSMDTVEQAVAFGEAVIHTLPRHR
jgi:hypothetical protein